MFFDRHLHRITEENCVREPSIKRLEDGSIDYSHYDARARRNRSDAFVKALTKARKLLFT
jgi:hypothetical protein